MKTYEIKTIQEVTQEQIDDLVTTALEGGITYWCDQATTDVDLEDNYLSEMLTRDAAISLHDAEEDKWYKLTIEKLLVALEDKPFDFDNYDAADADEVVQKAIFEEVVYG